MIRRGQGAGRRRYTNIVKQVWRGSVDRKDSMKAFPLPTILVQLEGFSVKLLGQHNLRILGQPRKFQVLSACAARP
jgi:hypothetical protein